MNSTVILNYFGDYRKNYVPKILSVITCLFAVGPGVV